MILKHLKEFKFITNNSNYLRRYCSNSRSIKIDGVSFEKVVKSKNPEFVPKKYGNSLNLSQ